MSPDGIMINATENIADNVIGSVRLAPLKAQSLNYRIAVAGLAGHWNHGMVLRQSVARLESASSVAVSANWRWCSVSRLIQPWP